VVRVYVAREFYRPGSVCTHLSQTRSGALVISLLAVSPTPTSSHAAELIGSPVHVFVSVTQLLHFLLFIGVH